MNKPELILIPGLNNTRHVFDGVLAALPPGMESCAVDCPALSSVEAIAADLLPQLPPRFWLGGFSFGGYVALAMLEMAPERVQGIAMICTGPFADKPEQTEKRLASIAVAQKGGYLNMIEGQAANAFHPESLKNDQLMAARRMMVREYGAERFIAHLRATMARPDRAYLLDGSIPTAVIAASHDNVFPPAGVAQYAARIPGAHHVLIQDAGHLVPMEKPREVAAALASWINAGQA